MKYYFTYANVDCGMPFVGGWTEVNAATTSGAVETFRKAHPNPEDNEILNCSFIYDEDLFARTGMAEKGNYGKFCQEVINEETDS
ncbi:MAG: hypothetical protein J6T96_05345 [Bacteroidales bacterium]|nr:hypothetical protein [Bacteroidales bacterium]